MRGWLRGEGPRPATRDDLEYHFSTLFPFVRPRGFLELRVIDAQAGPDWEAVLAMTTALVDDEQAVNAAAEACAPVGLMADPMGTAAREALADPILAQAGRACAEAALEALERLGLDAATRARVERFAQRHTLRGRCPADDRLEHWHRTGEFMSTTEEEEQTA
jgi:glutamate--cysteine ligase